MVVIGILVFVMCVECHAVYALIVGPRRCKLLHLMFSSAKGAGFFAPAFCITVVVPAEFEASAYQHIIINVAYCPLMFEFILLQLSASLWLHAN